MGQGRGICRGGVRCFFAEQALSATPCNAHPSRVPTLSRRPFLQELLDCLETLLAVEKAEDVRKNLAAVLARKNAGLFSSFSGAVGFGGGGRQ